MQILLDTHAFIWFVEADSLLPQNLKSNLENPKNEIFLSMASIWEMGIKMSLGKLKINKTIEEIIELAEWNGFQILPILPSHIVRLCQLEFHHRDPFDRMLLAQCLSENLVIASTDSIFDSYGVNRIWEKL